MSEPTTIATYLWPEAFKMAEWMWFNPPACGLRNFTGIDHLAQVIQDAVLGAMEEQS